MTPAQLRTFAAIARLGSSRRAATELGVSEAAVSGHVAALRKELGDVLFRRRGDGLAFTAGGLRLAARSVELLGLQNQTIREIQSVGDGYRVLRLAVSSLFGEAVATGLIEMFSARAADLQVEMTELNPVQFGSALTTRAVDVAIGPSGAPVPDVIAASDFLRYQLVAVVGERHPLARSRASRDGLAKQIWLLGPSAVDPSSATTRLLQRLNIPDACQRLYPNHSAALADAQAGKGIALMLAHTANDRTRDGGLVRVDAPGVSADGMWATYALGRDRDNPLTGELLRFVSTPRAIQAMLSGSGANVARYRPRVHVTLWSGGWTEA